MSEVKQYGANEDRYYQCYDGFEYGEGGDVFIEKPRGPSSRRMICHTKTCKKYECNYHPFNDERSGKIPQNLPCLTPVSYK